MEFRATVSPPDARTLIAARASVLGTGARDTTGRLRRLRRRRAGWWAGGLGLTAAAAAVSMVVAMSSTATPTTPGGSDHGKTGAVAVSRLSGRQILLAAATVAAATPTRIGKYWRVKEIMPNLFPTRPPGWKPTATLESWQTHDGSEYDLVPGRNVAWESSPYKGFDVGSSTLTAEQVQHLPTDPGALEAWITRSWEHPIDGVHAPSTYPAPPVPVVSRQPQPASVLHDGMAMALTSLLYQVPAPPAVRAAAFRALASMPGVTKVGEVNGGVVLRISFDTRPPANKYPGGRLPRGIGTMRLIIDSSAFTLRAWSDYQVTTTILAAGWTNFRPRVVSPSQVNQLTK
ncbi:MAG TPA: hypothetical protein VGS19_19445 [Streptosporangiaceae bacterium]|nr:hypothetical protein [Streptosporangiaceae bacterium]